MAKQRKSEKPYDAAMNKYSEGVPAIGKIATEIALQLQIANTSIFKVDDQKTRFYINFRGDDKKLTFVI